MKRALFAVLVALGLTVPASADTIRVPSLFSELVAHTWTTGAQSFHDNIFFVVDQDDVTKRFTQELSGITTGNTVTMTLSGTAAAPTWTATGWTLNIGNGTANVPALAFAADADGSGTGLYRGGANVWVMAANGQITVQGTSADLTLGSGVQLGIQAGTVANPGLLFNADDDGSGTGIYRPAADQWAVAANGSTRDLINGTVKTLTDNSATTFARIAIASDSAAVITVFYEVDAENATDQQTIGGLAVIPIVNDAGAESCGTIVEAGEATHVSVGTITSTITCTGAGTNTIDLALTSDSSLNVSPLLVWRVIAGSSAGVTVTAQ